MKFAVFILLLIPLSASAQVVSVSPYSFLFWGQTPHYSEVSISYKMIGVHYFHPHEKSVLAYADKPNEAVYRRPFWAISADIISYKRIAYGGIVVFDKKFPEPRGVRVNFFLDVGVPINRFRISYRHISNGFGIFKKLNVGYDTITLSMSLGSS